MKRRKRRGKPGYGRKKITHAHREDVKAKNYTLLRHTVIAANRYYSEVASTGKPSEKNALDLHEALHMCHKAGLVNFKRDGAVGG